MKNILLFLITCLLLVSSVSSAIIDNKTSGWTSQDSLSFDFINPDSLGQPLGGLDTTKILVKRNGDSLFTEIIAGVTGRITKYSTGNGKYDTTYTYSFRVSDVDGDGTLGIYTMTILSISNETGAYLRWRESDQFQVVTSPLSYSLDSVGIAALATAVLQDSVNVVLDSLESAEEHRDQLLDSLNVILDSLELQSNWVSHQSTSDSLYDSLVVVIDSLESISLVLDIIRDSLQFLVTAQGFSTPSDLVPLQDSINITILISQSLHDTLIYRGKIFIDSSTGNTGIDFGFDGTPSNPVANLTAARALADSLGVNKYCIIGKGTYSLPSAHIDWSITAINENVIIDLNGQNIDGSTFNNMLVQGTQGNGTLGISTEFKHCTLDSMSNLKGDVFNTALQDTISLRTNTDTRFIKCYSNHAGNTTPVLNFGAGSVDVLLRGYFGGITIGNMTSNDNLSIETDGQVIIDASCINATIVIRGHIDSLIDNGTNTTFKREAALNGGYITRRIWDELKSLHIISDTYGDFLDIEVSSRASLTNQIISIDSINAILDTLQNQDDWVATLSNQILIIDSVYAILDSIQIYLDATVSSRSTFNATLDSVLSANIAEMAAEYADSILLADITGSFPNGTLGKFLKTIGTTIVRVENSRGMWNGKSNHVLLDVDAMGPYDPSVIRNAITGESHLIIEHDTLLQFVTTFRDFKIPFNSGEEFVILSDPGFMSTNDGRVRGATANTFTGNALVSDTNDTYKNQGAYFSAGLGFDQVFKIKSFNASTGVFTLYENFYTVPDTFTSYIIIPSVDGFESRFMDSLRGEPIPVVQSDTTTTGKLVGLMPDDWTAADSVAFQGPGSSLTVEAIDAELSANHGFGSWLTVGAGGGPNTVIIYTIDTTTNDTLSGINVFVENLTGAPEASGPTNVSGFIQFGLTAEQWNFKAGSNKTTYSFDDTTFTITTNPDTFSISGYPIVVTAPVNPDLCRVFGRVLNIGAVPDSGAVITAFLKAGIKDFNDNIVGPKKLTDTTDVDGDFFIDLIPSTLLDSLTARPFTAEATKYFFEIRRTDGRIIKQSVIVPNSGTWNLTW